MQITRFCLVFIITTCPNPNKCWRAPWSLFSPLLQRKTLAELLNQWRRWRARRLPALSSSDSATGASGPLRSSSRFGSGPRFVGFCWSPPMEARASRGQATAGRRTRFPVGLDQTAEDPAIPRRTRIHLEVRSIGSSSVASGLVLVLFFKYKELLCLIFY